MNILICEDNPIIAMDLGCMLEDMGHHVCGTADTSIKGIQQCALKKPDLVMVDLNLADGRTGLDLVNALADLCIPSVIVSGETHTLPTTTWAKAVVSKPFNEPLLTQALADVEADFQHHVAVEPAPEAGLGVAKVGGLRGLLWPWHK
ncbi:Two-component response regulator [Rubellimicrobium mesophilum DSM 19309]|uniref:Two-component response regulator n=1 Tax=Rubellimicrobium mesophilum DSM 19309 TaxID=442562 RepID=A0A017HVJ6_9RHOB|nr:response regulator [Rubellimicrobium mesophilum]EYD78406.1 Two-component response regulator [Rubellimicrobium mesophilum DSM 19309]